MDWTKIKTKHYINSGLTFAERGYHGTFCALVAHLEDFPTDRQLESTFGKKYRKILDKFPELFGKNHEEIAEKVLEDVCKLQHKRSVSRGTSKRYRDKQKESDTSRDTSVTRQRREEKRREEKTYPAEPAPSKESTGNPQPVDNPKMVNLRDVKVWDLGEPAKHKIYNQTIKIFTARGWPNRPEFLKKIFTEIVAKVSKQPKPRELYPYFNAVVNGYIRDNCERINQMAKESNQKDMSIGADNLLQQLKGAGNVKD